MVFRFSNFMQPGFKSEAREYQFVYFIKSQKLSNGLHPTDHYKTTNFLRTFFPQTNDNEQQETREPEMFDAFFNLYLFLIHVKNEI